MPSKIKILKNLKNIIIAVLIMLFLTLFLLIYTKYFFAVLDARIGVKSCDELTQMFYDNQSYFEEIADIGLSYEADDSRSACIFGPKRIYFGFLIPGKYIIYDYRQSDYQKDKDALEERIKNSNIKHIFKLNFSEVDISNNRIDFVYCVGRGIVYLKNKDVLYDDTLNVTHTIYTHLTGNWYVFDER